MSSALAKLREYFADELLVRIGREMVPTAQAAFFGGSDYGSFLRAVQHATTTRPTFDPGSAERTFHLMMSDYVATVFVAAATFRSCRRKRRISTSRLKRPMPACRLDWSGERSILPSCPDKFIDPEHPAEEIMQDGYVVVVDRGNRTIGDEISLDEYVSAEHVVTNLAGSRQASFEDWFLENFRCITKGDDYRTYLLADSRARVQYNPNWNYAFETGDLTLEALQHSTCEAPGQLSEDT